MIYTKRLDTDEDNKLFIGAFAVETDGREYVPQSALSQEPKGFVRIQLAKWDGEHGWWTMLFPRKEMRAKYLHKFMNWAANEDFTGKTVEQVAARLRYGHDNAISIGKFHV